MLNILPAKNVTWVGMGCFSGDIRVGRGSSTLYGQLLDGEGFGFSRGECRDSYLDNRWLSASAKLLA